MRDRQPRRYGPPNSRARERAARARARACCAKGRLDPTPRTAMKREPSEIPGGQLNCQACMAHGLHCACEGLPVASALQSMITTLRGKTRYAGLVALCLECLDDKYGRVWLPRVQCWKYALYSNPVRTRLPSSMPEVAAKCPTTGRQPQTIQGRYSSILVRVRAGTARPGLGRSKLDWTPNLLTKTRESFFR